MTSNLPRVVIVGGGAGGLELVTRLGKTLGSKRLAKVYLSDGASTHIWKPLLHEVATGTLNTGEDALNYFSHAYNNNYRFHYGYMDGLDRNRKVIQSAAITDLEGNVVSGPRELKYDTLVIAIGGQTNSFGTPGVDEHCLKLNNPRDAELVRKRILGYALAMVFQKISQVRIGIVGGGATGIELASEIHHTMKEIKSHGARFDSDALQISILEAAPTLLAAAPDSAHMAEFSEKTLKRKGIEVRTGCKINGVTDKGFILEDGSLLEKDIKIWTAGIKAPDWLSEIGLQTDRINRIIVNENLQSMDDPSIFALGDCSHCVDYNDKKRVLPASAQVAHQQAEWLAAKIRNDILNKATKTPFIFQSQGMLVSLGDSTAVGTMQNLFSKLDLNVKGKSAKLLYTTLYRLHQAAIYGNRRAFCIFLGDKLRGLSMPNVKLH